MYSEEALSVGKKLPARIQFLSHAQGGRLSPARDGIRPHLKLGDVMTTCVVRSCTAATIFEPEKVYEVEIEIVFWDQYSHLFTKNEPIQLFDGSRLIATGEFTV
jgi:hypothetical protein